MIQRHSSSSSRKDNKRSIHDFAISSLIGSGKYGQVYKAKDTISDTDVALKRFNMMSKEEPRIEIDIHRQLFHPNILQCYGYCCKRKRFYLILEYAPGGDVYGELQKEKVFSEEKTASYIRQTALALAHCHARQIIHRDVKPENLLLCVGGVLKLADFGWAISVVDNSKATEVCGTLDYLPPEMINNRSYRYAVDMWSLGVLLYEFLVGVPPFECPTHEETCDHIRRVKYVIPSLLSAEGQSLLTALLIKSPKKRPTAQQVAEHPWLQSN